MVDYVTVLSVFETFTTAETGYFQTLYGACRDYNVYLYINSCFYQKYNHIYRHNQQSLSDNFTGRFQR